METMDYQALLDELDQLLQETYALWPEGWVTFNWRGYTYDHVQRVRRLALNLCRQEGGDPVVTELAGLLHDITKLYDGEYITDAEGNRVVDEDGFWHNETRPPQGENAVTRLYDELGLAGQLHNESGATLADHLLRQRGVDARTSDAVARAIRNHLRPDENVDIESACLSDADTIDANIGLPAFVRNIYINLHFHDRRNPERPPIREILRDAPTTFLCPYITENLPNWVAGKRRDFIPRLITPAAVNVAMSRFDRLEAYFDQLAADLQVFGQNGHRDTVDVVLHYMRHRDEPSIADETNWLAHHWVNGDTAPQARAMIDDIQREMLGVD
jgi:putative nucleotidyltransferase with HDIG domain